MAEPITVPIGESDWVHLAPRLTVPAGSAVIAAIKAAESTESEVEAAIAAAFLRHCIVAWSFTTEDKDGRKEPVPITNATIAERLDWATAHDVAEKCNELYAADLFRPLLTRMAASSQSGRKPNGISAKTDSGPMLQGHLKPSSRHASGGKRSEARAR